MHFGAGRTLLPASVGVIFGVFFTAAGLFVMTAGGAPIMGTIFSLVGFLIVLSSFYAMLKSLEVFQEGGYIRTVRRVLGIPVKRDWMRQADIVDFDKKASTNTHTGNKHVVLYTISAVDSRGKKLLVGESFKGVSQADAAVEFITDLFGLKRRDSAPQVDPQFEDYDYLATD